MLTAVTFDYWNTLVYETPPALRDGRIAAWLGLLEEQGVSLTRQQLEEAHEQAFQSASASWKAGVQYRAEHAAEQVLGLLPSGAQGLGQQLVDSFSTAGAATELHVVPGLEDALESLKAAGVRVGIVCDVGLTPSPVLREHLRARGLLRHFDHWSFSDEVGHYKPSPEIFRHALKGLGVSAPADCVHVGDNRRTDVAGARAYGMWSARYTHVFDDPADLVEAHLVVSDHADLVRWVYDDSARAAGPG